MSSDSPVLYGKYQLISQLARGGMAEVFKAKAHGVEGFEKVLVIKRILPSLSENPRFVEMFINEAKIAVTLSHANIVQVFDLGHAEGTYFIAMEYVAGMDLASTLRRTLKARQRFPAGLAVYILCELTKGLDYAHRRRDSQMRPINIVHRDVSPSNVLCSYEGEVKLTDFGIAKARTQAVTELGVVKGKYAYMAPEQLLGGTLDARTDVFAAGTLLYEALAGVNPFQSGSSYDTLQKIRGAVVTPIKEIVETLPDDLVAIIERAMAPNPDKRYQSAGELHEDLMQNLYGTGGRVGPRDLSDFLLQLQSGASNDPAGFAEELRQAFEMESVTAIEELEQLTRVERGRHMPERRSQRAAATEQAEWRDVTVMVVGMDRSDPLSAKSIAGVARRFGGTLLEGGPGHRERMAHIVFGDVNPDGHDAENAARCALRLARTASATAAEGGSSTSVALALRAGRALVARDGTLVLGDHYDGLLKASSTFAERSESGQVLVDAATEKALREMFRLVSAGEQAPDAHLLASERSLTDTRGRFIGRRDVLKRIGEALGKTNQGELRVIGLRGEAGSGKSRLLLETTRRLALSGRNVGLHVAALTPQMRDSPLSAITEMLRVVLGVDELDPEALRKDRTTRLRELGLLTSEKAAVSVVLGLRNPEEKKHRSMSRSLRAALLRIIRKLAEDRLTVFSWDGAEYMDEESLRIMDEMLRNIQQANVGVILSYRPGYAPPWGDLPNYEEIDLAPLSDDETARLTASRLGSDEIPANLLRDIKTKSAGNPLYIEEYLKVLQESGSVTFEDGQVVYDDAVASLEVPKTLRGIVASRIARLAAPAHQVLQVAALMGERFNVEILARAAGQSVTDVLRILGGRQMEGLIVRGVATQDAGFSHDLVRQVLIEGVTLENRRQLNGAIAEAIVSLYPEHTEEMAERLARHHQAAGQYEEAVVHLRNAAAKYEREGAPESAIKALERAIDILTANNAPRRERALEMYEHIAELCFRSRNLSEGAKVMGRALEMAEGMAADRYLARFSMWRGRMLVAASEIEEGRRWLDRAQHVARGLTDVQLTRDVFIASADADARSGQYDRAAGFVGEALQMARDGHDDKAELESLLLLGQIYARMGDHKAAMSTLDDAKRLAEGVDDPALHVRTHRVESQIHYHARDPRASAEAATRAMEVAREAGLHYEVALNAHDAGEAYVRMGDHKRAFAALRNSYEVAVEHGVMRLQMSNLRVLGFIDAMHFGTPGGREMLQRATDYAIDENFVWDAIRGKYLLAIIDQHENDVERARRTLRDVLTLAAQHGHRNFVEDAEAALRQLDAGERIEIPA